MAEYIDFNFVKEHASFDDVLKYYGFKLQGSGEQVRFICPFHDDNKPSMSVNTRKNQFQCFGCDEKGNVLEFVAIMEDCEDNLRQAAKILAEICSIPLAAPKKSKARKNRGRRKPAHARSEVPEGDDTQEAPKPARRARRTAAKEKPDTSADTEELEEETQNIPLTFGLKLDPKHEYLEERGLEKSLVQHFELGFCNRGMMAGRICIPIHNPDGEVVGYCGRWASEDIPEEEDKYLLPPKFRKSIELFNIHRVMATGADYVVLVEGCFDAIALNALGVPVVALMGRTMSVEQVELLRHAGIRHVIIMMDGDERGREACDALLPLLARSFSCVAVDLPEGEDPATVADEWVLEHVEPLAA